MKKKIYDINADKETLVQDMIEFRNYLYQRKEQYDRYNELKIEQINVFGKNAMNKYYKARSAMTILMCIIAGAMFLGWYLITELGCGGGKLEEFMMNVCPDPTFSYALGAFAFFYFLISSGLISHYEEKMKRPALNRSVEREELVEELKAYYDAYEKPQPVTYQYSNPQVLQAIINNLRRDDIKNLGEAIQASQSAMYQ